MAPSSDVATKSEHNVLDVGQAGYNCTYITLSNGNPGLDIFSSHSDYIQATLPLVVVLHRATLQSTEISM